MHGLRIRPANAASWEEIRAIFGARGEPSRCLCQRMRQPHRAWHDMPLAEREARLRAQTGCGHPGAPATSGLVAWAGTEPVGWCAVEPRPVFARLMQAQTIVPWGGRAEDRADAGVWAVGCFVTRAALPEARGDAGADGGDRGACARAGRAGGGGLSDGCERRG
jgi:hypothetical protein